MDSVETCGPQLSQLFLTQLENRLRPGAAGDAFYRGQSLAEMLEDFQEIRGVRPQSIGVLQKNRFRAGANPVLRNRQCSKRILRVLGCSRISELLEWRLCHIPIGGARLASLCTLRIVREDVNAVSDQVDVTEHMFQWSPAKPLPLVDRAE